MKFLLLVESYLKGLKDNVEDLKLFIEKRAAGAKKIAESAAKKGKYSTLTAIHFKAKEVPYNFCSKNYTEEDHKHIEEKADRCFNQLKSWKKMSQREFQAVMGELEAYGEVYIRTKETYES
jgi:hypothetical protein